MAEKARPQARGLMLRLQTALDRQLPVINWSDSWKHWEEVSGLPVTQLSDS